MGKKKIKQKKKISPRKRKVRFAFKVALLVVLLITLIAAIIFYFTYGRKILEVKSEAEALVSKSTEETFKKNQTGMVFDTEGNMISKLKGEKDVYYLDYKEIPDMAKQAMISIEDKNFTKHTGIDFKANIRAILAYIRNDGKITQGASTITQQLSRNIFLTHEVTFDRKIKEIFIARALENKYPKYKILEFYLNNVYFANGYYGIQAASKGYFSRGVDELSLSEIAFLCAIPNNPTLYDPLDKIENTIKRRDRILLQMYNDGAISKEEYDKATKEEITLKTSSLEKQNYVYTYTVFAATEALMENSGFEFKYEFDSEEEKKAYEDSYNELYTSCQQDLFSKGYQIYTSIDMKKQEELQKAIDEQTSNFTDKAKDGTYELQSAGVCIDNETGQVVAIVGGRSQEDMSGYTLNRAYKSYRQPGSSIKPVVVYTPALQRGYTPEKIVYDKKIEDGPSNSDGRYLGAMTLRKAVEKSRNTVAYQIFEDITPYYGISFLYNMGFHKIVDSDYYPTAGIGGLTNGVSPIEMASAYATIQNDGKYRKPTCIVKIQNPDGESIYENKGEEKKVYDSNASRTMTNILEGVLKSGTAKGYALKDMACAGKTGTTNSNKDGWFVGYTPYYTTSVWVGCDMPKSISNLQGNTYPLKIWNQFMTVIHEDLAEKEFEQYKSTAPRRTPAPTQTVKPTEEPEETIDPTEPTEEDDDYWDKEGDAVATEEPTTRPSKEPNHQNSNIPTKTEPPIQEEVPTTQPVETPAPTQPPVPPTQPPQNAGSEAGGDVPVQNSTTQ